jgi:hypothetical protein
VPCQVGDSHLPRVWAQRRTAAIRFGQSPPVGSGRPRTSPSLAHTCPSFCAQLVTHQTPVARVEGQAWPGWLSRTSSRWRGGAGRGLPTIRTVLLVQASAPGPTRAAFSRVISSPVTARLHRPPTATCHTQTRCPAGVATLVLCGDTTSYCRTGGGRGQAWQLTAVIPARVGPCHGPQSWGLVWPQAQGHLSLVDVVLGE